MSLAFWFLAGLAVGLVRSASLIWTVGRLKSGAMRRSRKIMWRGYLFRVLSATLALLVAMRRSPWAGLWVAGGLWFGRWVPVYLGSRGKIDWSWFAGTLEE